MKRDIMIVPRFGLSTAITSLVQVTQLCGVARSEFTVLHNFTEVSDGRSPNGVSARIGTTFYSVAEYGAVNGNGAVWSLDATTNSFANLHDFRGLGRVYCEDANCNPSDLRYSSRKYIL